MGFFNRDFYLYTFLSAFIFDKDDGTHESAYFSWHVRLQTIQNKQSFFQWEFARQEKIQLSICCKNRQSQTFYKLSRFFYHIISIYLAFLEKGRQSPVFNFNFPQYDKKRENRKSQSPHNTSNKLNTTELCYVDLLSKVALSTRSHSACLEKKNLAMENSTADLSTSQITKSSNRIIWKERITWNL